MAALSWELGWGAVAEGHREMLLADESWRNSRQADSYFARPEIPEGLNWYLHAFFDLSGERHEALASLPYSALALYADRHNLAGDDFDRFLAIMRALDGEYISSTSKKMHPPKGGKH